MREAPRKEIHEKTGNPYIDVAKFIMALLVVAIHVNPADGEPGFIIVNVVARAADPVFFIITAYFLFAKIKKTGWKQEILKNYIKRIAILYAAALIIYSPKIISNCRQACDNVFDGILWLAKRILFQGPYGALWFLTALFLAITLTYISTKYLGCKKTILISFLFYLPSILYTEYGEIFSNFAPLQYFTIFITKLFGWYANGLTFGFFFCSIGMAFAFEVKKGSLKKDVLFLLLFFAALFAEAHLIRDYGLGYDYWALFFLIPVCIYGMKVLIELPTPSFILNYIDKAKFLRKISILIFVFHVFFRDCLDAALGSYEWYYQPPIRYVLTVFFTILFSALIIELSRFKYFKFLRYLY